MKEFFKMVFATMVGMLLFGLVMTILGVMCIIGMVASGSGTRNVEDNSVMVMNLTGSMDERSEGSVLSMITGEGAGTAAALCAAESCMPRDLEIRKLQAALSKQKYRPE